MIDAIHDVEINGVKYLLAEGAEGQHYDLSGEPLRPPNAVMVQGEGRQDKFQARADMLLWNITDWSGGEGQITFDPQDHNRHALLHKVDPFEEPGKLLPGRHVEVTQDSTGAADFAEEVILVNFGGTLYGISRETVNTYAIWDSTNEKWGATATFTGTPLTGLPQMDGVVADEDYIYIKETGARKVWRWDGTASAPEELSNTLITTAACELLEMEDYIYVIRQQASEVYEIPKTGTLPTTPVKIWSGIPYRHTAQTDPADSGHVTRGPNRGYFVSGDKAGSYVVEITPTSAAGPGYGREIAALPGFFASSIWWHDGTLFLGGNDQYALQWSRERVLLYLTLEGTYGTLGRVRPPAEELYYAHFLGSIQAHLLNSYFVTRGTEGDTRLWVLDSVSGGFACVGESSYDTNVHCLVAQGRDVFVSLPSDDLVLRWTRDGYATDGYAVTPWHDMGLSDEKILSSVVLSVEAMPADWEVIVSYAVNGSTSFTTAGTYSTTSGTGTKYTISTDTTTKKFRTLRIKIAFNYTGSDDPPTTAPKVHGVEVRAQVVQPVPVWNLLLDLSDDHSNAAQSHSGARKFVNIKAAGDAKDVIAFKDGYPDRRPGQYTEYDVVVDAYRLILDKPGEGVAAVSLREVV